MTKIIMISYSIIFLALLPILHAISLPCSSSCASCSSATQCTTCASQYFANSTSGSLQCQPCGSFCLTCTSSTNCTICINPYVLQANGSCLQCQISNAAKCSSTVSASQCISGYYPNDNYCYSCLLNCADCSSSSDCKSCVSGYYLNSSVLTCNLCPSNCLSCDQYNSARCLSCQDGYTLSSGYTCDQVSCSIANCRYCASSTVCSQCYGGYYWSASSAACQPGASVMCEYGAEGPFPNQCNRKCSAFGYVAQTVGTALWCLPYTNIDINGSSYYQLYLYSYSNSQAISSLLTPTPSSTLTAEPSGEYSILVNSGSILSIPTLPSFYKLTLAIKYRTVSSQPILLTLTSITESQLQSQPSTLTPSSFSSVPISSIITTVYLHSNNFNIKFENSSIYLIELLIRTKNCPSYCSRCLNEDLCQMCAAPQYVSAYKCVDNCTIYYHLVTNRTCLTACPDLFYPVNLGVNQKYCQPCISPCLKCLAADKCLSCVSGKYLFNYTCIAVCPDTYYPNPASGLCEPCISPCRLCTNQTSCISCKEGFWDAVNSVCTVQCPLGYYGDAVTQSCQRCQSPCLTCMNTSTHCLSCLPSLYFQDYACLVSCPSRYYPLVSSLTCQPCRLPCLTCSSSSVCLTCSYDYLFNGNCISSCPLGYYEDVGSKTCSPCSASCKSCQTQGECTSCKVGTCFLSGACVASCPSNKYYALYTNQSTPSQECVCQQCPYPCKECLPSSQCSSCLQGYLLQATHECLNSCPVSYFANSLTFECSTCTSKYTNSCLECNVTSCTRCLSSYMLHNGVCLSSCPAQHYSSSETCQKCVPPCLECSSFTVCLSCVTPYLFSSGSCIIQCPFGKVPSLNISTSVLTCQSCQYPCITCQSSPTNCTICAYTYFLNQINNTCISQCSSIVPVSTYYNELVTSTCAQCIFPCKTCSSQTQCLSCQIGFLSSNFKCEYCGVGTFANETLGICVSCPSQCSNCYAINYCTGCNNGFYLYGHQCISNLSICTSNGYYPLGRSCQPCQMPCLQCNLSSTMCLSCVAGYIFSAPSSCITECPLGSFRNGSQCSACHPFCQSCSGSATNCFICHPQYFMVSSLMTCVSSCPNDTFIVGATCQSCQYPCKQCLSQTQCTSCVSGTLVNNTCMSSCPSGYFSNSLLQCVACQSPCLQCQISATTCKMCVNGYYLYNSQCLSACPSLYFGESQAHQCLQCLGMCQNCASHVNCTSCSSNLTFYYNTLKNYGQCLSECPVSFYPITVTNSSTNISHKQCAACLPQCLTCQNNQSCILCNSNRSQYHGQCLIQCPAQMFTLNGICQACSAPCFNCTDAFTCTACMNNSFLLVGSAECIVGQVCPLGYYRIPGTRNCNGHCPVGYYHRNDRTCNDSGCDVDQYKGEDWFCYKQCQDGYKADSNFICRKCSNQQCSTGLFYDIKPAVIRDQLFLYIIFKQDPIYTSSANPIITLTPHFNSKITTLATQRLLTEEAESNTRSLVQVTPAIRNITIELFPQQSFAQLSLNIKFMSALATFQNPIQRTSKTIVLEGFDIYPQTRDVNIGFLLLACALVGMVKSPYMTDFGQIVYLMALVDLHYPNHLASALQSTKLAHLHGILKIQQIYALGKGKFAYITDMGLISNDLVNLIFIAAGLLVFLLTFVVYHILKRALSYNKVDQDPNSINQQKSTHSQQLKKNKHQQTTNEAEITQQVTEIVHDADQPKSIQFLQCLQQHFISNFKMGYLNRLVYFNYLPLSLFTISQLNSLSFTLSSLPDLLASILCFPVLILLLIFPYIIYSNNKPKYTFLMLRKLVLSVILVISVQNPTYMIGVSAVMSIMSGILVGAYGMEKWKVETKFNAGMEIMQAILLVFFAIFAIVGSGAHTSFRLVLGWIILFGVLGICLSYLTFQVFCFVLWICKKCYNTDYIEIWATSKSLQKQTDNNSQTSNNDPLPKQHETSAEPQKSVTFQKLITNVSIPKQFTKQLNPSSDTPQKNTLNPKTKKPKQNKVSITNNQLFWTYNDNDEVSQNNLLSKQKKAPQILIRCVNQFSDFDQKQIIERMRQQKQELERGNSKIESEYGHEHEQNLNEKNNDNASHDDQKQNRNIRKQRNDELKKNQIN